MARSAPASPRTGASVVGVVAALALMLSVLPVSPVHATHDTPMARGVEQACPPDRVADSGFTDTAGNTHDSAIECIAVWGIAQGRTLTTYAPAGQTRRDQMASFIARLLETAGADVPRNAPRAFDDVPPDNVHFEAVNALAQLGITVGQPDGLYQPARPVRRDQMASFISRSAENALGAAPTDEHQWFADVHDSNVHAAAVNGLAAAGVVQGRDAEARRYAPGLSVRRDAMASFVGRTLDLLAAEGVVTFPPAVPAARASMVDTNGAQLGEIVFSGGADSPVDVRARLEGLPAGGFHGFHIHEAGACEPDFTAAGGHHNPEGQSHGAHAGDMPVLMVGDDGTATIQFVSDRITVDGLLAGDGSAVVIHAAPDNYATIPERYAPAGPDEATLATGDAGARIACGVVAASSQLPPVVDPPPPEAQARVVDDNGARLGDVLFAPRTGGVVEVLASFENLPPGGFHGFHIHEAGACEPDFTAAGGHHNPEGQSHGAHAGDMPVLMVGDDGRAVARFVTDRVTVEGLLAGDGSAVVVHAAPDNYATIPERYAPAGPDEATLATGDAGARIACGVVGPAGP